MISFLLYDPHALQTLCGIIKAPHLLHFTKFGAVIFQFALRLSLLALEVLFFGQIDMVCYTSLKLLKMSRIFDILGSNSVVSQLQVCELRFAPHLLQIPLQFSLQRTFIGK